ncbi:unnamed protein product [Urochloa decumbens]|uniref:Leucine-rich repeat-containing N-terminal plant-type domain-containing protein n=1 Tax=Urochloa decumbens TaxID=240449 RepID=A0ABC9B9P4_9POAL
MTILLVLLGCLLLPAAAQSQPVGEAKLLLEIKRVWGDPPKLAAWSAATSTGGAHCRWPYIGCDSTGRVTSLALAGINVTGPIPDAIGGLSSLARLDVSYNRITGAFPTALYRCRSLRYLNLFWNHIGGELPDDIGRGLAANLSTLNLGVNKFNGTIPVSLSRLRNLRHLALEENLFVGSIPMELGELTSLEILNLAGNLFDAGHLPASFKNLTNLNLEWLDVSGNNLTGDVVVDDFTAMSLVFFCASENNLTGMIPEVFGRLRNLTYMLLSNNNCSGEIPLSIDRMPSLKTLSLSGNRLTGTLPSELGKYSLSLYDVSIADNKLTGTIPEWLCAGGHLESLSASSNRLNGSIPVRLANCANLVALWTIRELVVVFLRNNSLTGSLPAMMSNNLRELDIGNNRFVGKIPTAALGLVRFIAENNQFSGEIPSHIGYGMPLLRHLNFANNKLSGSIG